MPQPKQAAAKKPPPLTPPKAPAAKTNGARKISRTEAAKAIADLKAEPRKGSWRGVQFDLPPMLPATFAFDVGEMMADEGLDFGLVHNLMVSIVGADAWRAMRAKIAEDGVGFDQLDDLLAEFFAAVMEPYGMDLGESSASTAA